MSEAPVLHIRAIGTTKSDVDFLNNLHKEVAGQEMKPAQTIRHTLHAVVEYLEQPEENKIPLKAWLKWRMEHEG